MVHNEPPLGPANGRSSPLAEDSESGLYVGEDDYGTTYYYRGNVTNNYVYFADVYWRIIRLNGAGNG